LRNVTFGGGDAVGDNILAADPELVGIAAPDGEREEEAVLLLLLSSLLQREVRGRLIPFSVTLWLPCREGEKIVEAGALSSGVSGFSPSPLLCFIVRNTVHS